MPACAVEVAVPLPVDRAFALIILAGRAFVPRRGVAIFVRNDDTRTHNVRVHDPRLAIDSGAQEPGETVRLAFRQPGTYTVFCGIHPTMKLVVEVAR